MTGKAAQTASRGARAEVQVKCLGGLGSPADSPGCKQLLRVLLKIPGRLDEANFW